MNILILNWRDTKSPISGGAELVTLEHAKRWVAEGHKVTWFASRYPGLQKEEVIDGISIVRRGGALGVYIFAPFFYLFSGQKFDVVIDEIHGIPFFTPLYVKKPKIAFIHEVAGEIWDFMYPFPVNILGKLIEKFFFLFYKNTQFWTVSDSTKKDLETMGIPQKHITIIPNGLHIEKIGIVKKEENPTFIFVSRLVKMKGIERVLKAFEIIVQDTPKAKLWIVGTGKKDYVRFLKSKVVHLGSTITFWGRVSEEKKLELMGKAHLLLHASVKEGWGLVVVEAASQGTPAVVYNVNGLRDVVKNGVTGIVLQQNSPEEMAKESLQLLQDTKTYKKYQENGLTFTKNLSWDKVATRSLELLKSL